MNQRLFQIMPEIEHNAPRFQYRVSWKRDIPGEGWSSDDIVDWRRSEHLVSNLPTFQRYQIKVVAMNEKGQANVAAKEVIGYSGEDVPTQAPTNFTIVQVVSATSAILSWNPVPLESIRGHYEGYKIQTWTDKDGENGAREILVKGDSTRVHINKFVPDSKNYVRVLVYNGRYNGPASETLNFKTMEGVPGTVQMLEASALGSSALYLTWKQPEQPNGQITGYKIYYQTVKGTKVGPLLERDHHIPGSKLTHAKLAGLEPGTMYRVTVKATTRAGEGEGYFVEKRTRGSQAAPPDTPRFNWFRLQSENGFSSVKVVWLPNLESSKPGSHFFVKYR